MKQYKVILWDVDGTLLDFHFSQRYAIKKCFETIGKSLSDDWIERYSQINDSYWKRLELGEISKEEVLKGRFITLFEQMQITGVDLDSFLKEYQVGLGSVYEYIDDSLSLCKKLKEDGFRQYIITNGVASTQYQKLSLSSLDKYMEDIFISEELEAVKPQAQFFERCFQRMKDIHKAETIIVGDALSSDIKGGNNAGIKTCWYNPKNSPKVEGIKADYEIKNLWELEQILIHTFS